jgi:hypothetical protein
MDEDVQRAVQADGSLYDLGWYLSWTVGRKTAVLDGTFTSQQLRDIADHMDRHKPTSPEPPSDAAPQA